MPATLAVAAAAAFALSGQVDTLVTVRPGTELQVANFAGEVKVVGWDRNAVRIQTEAPGRQVVLLDGEVGDTEPAARAQDPCALGQNP